MHDTEQGSSISAAPPAPAHIQYSQRCCQHPALCLARRIVHDTEQGSTVSVALPAPAHTQYSQRCCQHPALYHARQIAHDTEQGSTISVAPPAPAHTQCSQRCSQTATVGREEPLIVIKLFLSSKTQVRNPKRRFDCARPRGRIPPLVSVIQPKGLDKPKI